ncbi:hypothetical protein G7068_04470 [Leucobacter viscericola]|uniref:Small secreted protein n=1 Tax=Leucobacter viscericola TaxID=2714935 RepID=A0A6G7XDB5_9MICO|nr:hypothetical protein [Leucobacter viscericola]QIK62543.1 hypothetical protein G7068_04470 [Leucobacter viscericola]
MKSTLRIGAVVAAIALASTLSACSGGQSVTEACKVANSTVNEATSDMNTLLQDAMSGNGDFSKVFDPINKALDEAQSKVTNEKVSKSLKTVADEFSAMGEDLKGYKVPDVSSIDMTAPDASEKLEAMSKESEAVSAKLQKRSESLQKAGTDLQKVCNAG